MNKRDWNTRVRRLKVLRDYLAEQVSARRFNMWRWASPGFESNHCSSTGCALGHACLIPAFRKAGLHLRDYHPTLDISTNFVAGARFFSLNPSECRFLFDPETYKGMARGKHGLNKVIRRIDWLLEKAPTGQGLEIADNLNYADRKRLHVLKF